MIALALDLWMYTTEFAELGGSGGSGGSAHPTYFILGF